ERLARDLDHRDGDGRVGEVHRDPAAHRAGAQHGRPPDLLRRRVGRDVGDLRGLALGEEEVALRLRLRRVQQLEEELPLTGESRVERQGGRGLDRPDAALRRPEPARLPRHRFAEGGEELGPAARRGELVLEVANLLERPPLAHDLLGEGAFGGLPNSVMSAPAMKVRPAQVTTMAPTAASAVVCLTPSCSPWRTCWLSALTGGLLTVRTAMRPRRSRSTDWVMAVMALLFWG